jgi:hypothetical protein
MIMIALEGGPERFIAQVAICQAATQPSAAIAMPASSIQRVWDLPVDMGDPLESCKIQLEGYRLSALYRMRCG